MYFYNPNPDDADIQPPSWQVANGYCFDVSPELYVITHSRNPLDIDEVWQEKQRDSISYYDNEDIVLTCEGV